MGKKYPKITLRQTGGWGPGLLSGLQAYYEGNRILNFPLNPKKYFAICPIIVP